MKLGLQTICWGPRIQDVEYLCKLASALGFQGIEFAQPPPDIGGVGIHDLLDMMKKHRLELIGLAGGSLVERVEFCKGHRPEYLYVEDWDPLMSPSAEDLGFRLALHPHVFKPIFRVGHAQSLLDSHPNLSFILDTAHLSIAGEKIAEALQASQGRLAAVHAKDWRPVYGRYSHRYAKGFTELGNGILHQQVHEVISRLADSNYRGWIIWEQDVPSVSPEVSALVSAEWLHHLGYFRKQPDFRRARELIAQRTHRSIHGPNTSAHFIREIHAAATRGPEECYSKIVRAFYDILPSRMVALWRCATSQRLATLVASYPAAQRTTQRCGDLLSGYVIDRLKVTRFDLTNPENIRRFSQPELLERYDLRRMISIPILNPWNLNHVVMILNLFPEQETIPFSDDELVRLGEDVAIAVDAAIDELCTTAAGTVNYRSWSESSSNAQLQALRETTQEFLRCGSVTIFTANEAATRLTVASSTGVEWMVPESEQYYAPGEGLTGQVWASREPFMTQDASSERAWKGKSREGWDKRYHNCLLFPLARGEREPLGVIRCSNKLAYDHSALHTAFSEDDVAVLDAIVERALPHYELTLANERRSHALGRLTHELKVPVVAMRAAAELMQQTDGVTSYFDHDYPGDVWSWSELMRRLLDNFDSLRYSDSALKPHQTPTLMMRDVIAPAANQVTVLLRERDFQRNRIEYRDFKRLPRLLVDRYQFQQVAFNLLANAIKHCYDDPDRFRVEITARVEADWVGVDFSDWGPGIQDGMEQAIFKEGVRGDFATEKEVRGDGLGLWVVNRILEAHSGDVVVHSKRNPTTFRLRLPRSLEVFSPIRGL